MRSSAKGLPGSSILRANPHSRATPVASRTDSGMRPSLLLTLLVAMATLGAPGSANAAAGILSCVKLEQNCEAYVTRMKNALRHTRPDQAGQHDPHKFSAERCQEQYSSAERTGIWPAYGVMPALPCSKN
jgi:hypothetical protein